LVTKDALEHADAVVTDTRTPAVSGFGHASTDAHMVSHVQPRRREWDIVVGVVIIKVTPLPLGHGRSCRGGRPAWFLIS